jgi:hypothetical protein
MPKLSQNNGFADPVVFAEKVFGVTLWDAQRAIIRAIPVDRRIACKAAPIKRAFWDNLKRQTRDHSCSRWAASFNRWRARSVISCVR